MAGDHDCSSSGLDNGLDGQKQEMMAVDHDFSSSWNDKGSGGQKQEVMSGDHNSSSSGLDKGLGGQKQEVMVGDHDCSSSCLDEGLGGRKKEVMVGDHDCSTSGLEKGPSGIGQVTDFPSPARELRTRKSQNDVAASSTEFWRAPEVLQAQSSGAATPLLSPAADVYSYGMLGYEMLTGEIPFGKELKSNYDIVISGGRPEVPAYLNHRMKDLLSCCWRANPQERPGWTWIIEILKKERRRCPLLTCDWETVDSGLWNNLPVATMWCKRRFNSSLIGMAEMEVERKLKMQQIKNDDNLSVDNFNSHETDDDDNMSQPLGL